MGKRRARAVRKPIPWRKQRPQRRIMPGWLPLVTVVVLTVLLVLTINFRAYSELSREQMENQQLNDKIQQATTENITLQEEIYYLKNDPRTIEREARKFGLERVEKKEQVSRAGNPDKAEKSVKPANTNP